MFYFIIAFGKYLKIIITTIIIITACLSYCKVCSNSLTCTKCYEDNGYYLLLYDSTNNYYKCSTCNTEGGYYITTDLYKHCESKHLDLLFVFFLFFLLIYNHTPTHPQKKLYIIECFTNCLICSDTSNCTKCNEGDSYYLTLTDETNNIYSCATCDTLHGYFIDSSTYK